MLKPTRSDDDIKTVLIICVIILLSVMVGVLAPRIGATRGESLVAGLYTTLLGLLIENRRIYKNLKKETLATTGSYARLRHPQYAGFALVMVGFLLQWPTLATLVMFPVLMLVYRRLAIREECEVAERFGAEWERYARATPRFVPRLQRAAPAVPDKP